MLWRRKQQKNVYRKLGQDIAKEKAGQKKK